MEFLFECSTWFTWTQEEKFHIYKQPCICFLLYIEHTNDNFFDDFLKISKDESEILIVLTRAYLF